MFNLDIHAILILLIFWHFLADYPLQGDFLSRAKNRANPIPGVPWYQAMGAHAFLHAAGVWFITGSALFGLYELVAHALIDDAKCRGRIGFNGDQFLHIACKVGYCIAIWVSLP